MIFNVTIETGETLLKLKAHGRNEQEAINAALRQAIEDDLINWQGAERSTCTAQLINKVKG